MTFAAYHRIASHLLAASGLLAVAITGGAGAAATIEALPSMNTDAAKLEIQNNMVVVTFT